MRISTIALLSLMTMTVSACGSTLPPPNDEWTAANTDVGRAQAGGAPNVPDAKLHLQLAQEKLQQGKDLIDKDNVRAASLIALARAEAQLALSISKASQADAQARQAQQDVQKAKGN